MSVQWEPLLNKTSGEKCIALSVLESNAIAARSLGNLRPAPSRLTGVRHDKGILCLTPCLDDASGHSLWQKDPRNEDVRIQDHPHCSLDSSSAS